jgi:signal transduction histidine kinase
VGLVRAAVASAQVTTDRHELSLVASVSQLTLRIDADRINRVLFNLLTNAIKFSPDGGKIRLELSEIEDAYGRYAQLVVRDPGIGILPQDLAHVFDPFFRGANAVTTAPGVGAGLASARRIVDLHGGTISVTSQPGQGSAFTLRLPLRRASRPPGGHA